MSPHKLRIAHRGAKTLADYLAGHGNDPELREAVLEGVRSLATNPTVGRKYDGPGQMYFHVMQVVIGKGRHKRGYSVGLTYERIGDEVVLLGVGKVGL